MRPSWIGWSVSPAGNRADLASVTSALAASILDCVERIPPGHVMTYGDVAEYAGARSARLVGRVLSVDGGTVPWHRVVRADGTCADHLYSEQRQLLISEGVRFRDHRVDLARYRWDGRA
jgi:methylated-DNA-protein-cysteine methyltransferase related protein